MTSKLFLAIETQNPSNNCQIVAPDIETAAQLIGPKYDLMFEYGVLDGETMSGIMHEGCPAHRKTASAWRPVRSDRNRLFRLKSSASGVVTDGRKHQSVQGGGESGA